MNKFFFIIPFYDKGNIIPQDYFIKALKKFIYIDFLSVNDGSTDEKKEIIEKFFTSFSNEKVLNLDKNQGKLVAIRSGVLHSKDLSCDYFGYIDTVLSTPILEMKMLLDFAKANQSLKVVKGNTKIKFKEFINFPFQLLKSYSHVR